MLVEGVSGSEKMKLRRVWRGSAEKSKYGCEKSKCAESEKDGRPEVANAGGRSTVRFRTQPSSAACPGTRNT